mmetsp:Transcript_24589/g.73953  ORF Transcript_24589/g.73953 Transcript_24589/m.73953 type:complete len:216 (-) Transcript_24589:102-749(-)
MLCGSFGFTPSWQRKPITRPVKSAPKMASNCSSVSLASDSANRVCEPYWTNAVFFTVWSCCVHGAPAAYGAMRAWPSSHAERSCWHAGASIPQTAGSPQNSGSVRTSTRRFTFPAASHARVVSGDTAFCTCGSSKHSVQGDSSAYGAQHGSHCSGHASDASIARPGSSGLSPRVPHLPVWPTHLQSLRGSRRLCHVVLDSQLRGMGLGKYGGPSS